MSSKLVLDFLLHEGLSTVQSVAHEPSDDGGQYFVSITVTRNRRNRQTPPNNKLLIVRSKAAALGLSIKYVIKIDGQSDLETDLRATLTANFEPYVRTAYTSLKHRNAHVWIDQKKSIPDDVFVKITQVVNEALRSFECRLASLTTLQGANFPSKLVVLSTVRQLAPVKPDELAAALVSKDFSVPSDNWLNHQLDKFRKNLDVVRNKSGSYALTARSLKALGTKKSRQSPDITRLLALAKGKG